MWATNLETRVQARGIVAEAPAADLEKVVLDQASDALNRYAEMLPDDSPWRDAFAHIAERAAGGAEAERLLKRIEAREAKS
ncbi:MAG: hypothetical protein M3N47_02685 [Chloroflexota bacterium]|nr:hypothetical protein [Chloroflexota bacterium]